MKGKSLMIYFFFIELKNERVKEIVNFALF